VSLASFRSPTDLEVAAREMKAWIEELYPICRSITGDGLRETLRAVARRVPIEIHEIPSGTQAFDWTVPDEWNISDAFVRDASGRRVIDYRRSNLHVVNYSEPVRTKLPLAALKKKIFTLPDHPDWIPTARRTTSADGDSARPSAWWTPYRKGTTKRSSSRVSSRGL
jgi:aminopeptidase-like protein